ncbi:hypothetical protein D7X33_09005 [Butyricicoccus sp. 1XD8-22]|nr:hypothetical protein D7X33_09005 [Butyricicoccus sp. 1XD8-22]
MILQKYKKNKTAPNRVLDTGFGRKNNAFCRTALSPGSLPGFAGRLTTDPLRPKGIRRIFDKPLPRQLRLAALALSLFNYLLRPHILSVCAAGPCVFACAAHVPALHIAA